MAEFKPEEMARVQAYLQTKLGTSGLTLMRREKANDSAEVMLNGEFIAVIYKDEDEGETSFDLNMAILEEDLPGSVG